MDFIKAQSADGGGDFPEAVGPAMTEGLKLDWSSDAYCKIMFLLLDAPAHDDEQTVAKEGPRDDAQVERRLLLDLRCGREAKGFMAVGRIGFSRTDASRCTRS